MCVRDIPNLVTATHTHETRERVAYVHPPFSVVFPARYNGKSKLKRVHLSIQHENKQILDKKKELR